MDKFDAVARGSRPDRGDDSPLKTGDLPRRRVIPSTSTAWLLLVPILVWGAGDSLGRFDAETPVPAILSTVDVNHAPWWELAMLPRIGEGKAKAIVAFREAHANPRDEGPSSPVFRSPADLQKIRGIGPKTVARVAPHIRFGPPERRGAMKDESA